MAFLFKYQKWFLIAQWIDKSVSDSPTSVVGHGQLDKC